jgi:mono/diheme cytochrome c family protein
MNKIDARLADAFRWLAISALLIAVLRSGFAADLEARERGSLVFQTHGCLRCHSITGAGGDRAPDLGSVGLRRGPGQIRRQIVHGGHGMPPFGKVLSAGDINDLVEFLSACRSDEAPGCRNWEGPVSK